MQALDLLFDLLPNPVKISFQTGLWLTFFLSLISFFMFVALHEKCTFLLYTRACALAESTVNALLLVVGFGVFFGIRFLNQK